MRKGWWPRWRKASLPAEALTDGENRPPKPTVKQALEDFAAGRFPEQLSSAEISEYLVAEKGKLSRLLADIRKTPVLQRDWPLFCLAEILNERPDLQNSIAENGQNLALACFEALFDLEAELKQAGFRSRTIAAHLYGLAELEFEQRGVFAWTDSGEETDYTPVTVRLSSAMQAAIKQSAGGWTWGLLAGLNKLQPGLQTEIARAGDDLALTILAERHDLNPGVQTIIAKRGGDHALAALATRQDTPFGAFVALVRRHQRQ